jgi:hypothetical protein
MSASSSDAPDRDQPFGSPAVLAVLLSCIAICRLQILVSTWGYDSGAWMYISHRLLGGATPYVDVWDNKLPPIFWIGMAYLATGVPRVAMFVAEVGLTAIAALVVARLARRSGIGPRWAPLFGGLFVCASMPVWEYPHRLETYALAALAPAVLLLFESAFDRERGGVRAALGAGALFALAASIRPQHALDAVLLGAWVLFAGEQGRLRRFAAYVGGGAAFTSLLLLAAWMGGYLQPMVRDAVRGSIDYASGDMVKSYVNFGSTAWELRVNVSSTPLVWASFGLACAFAASTWSSMGSARRALFSLSALLFASQFACTFLAWHQISHYHYPLAWSATLAAAVAVSASGLRAEHEMPRQRWLPSLSLGFLFLTTAFPEADVYEGLHRVLRPAGEERVDRLEELVRRTVPENEALCVLDDYSVVGVLSRLPNPAHDRWIVFAIQCHFFDPAHPPEGRTPYDVTSAERGRTFRAHLEQSPPPWIVRVTGIEDELTPWLQQHYRQADSNGEFTVWSLLKG